MTTPTIASSQSWVTYLDIDEVKAWLQFPANASTAQDPMLQRVIDMACEWISNEINRPVAPTVYTERHDGWSGSQILLNQYPIIELVSCAEYQSTGGFIELPESTPENPVDGVQVNYLTGELGRVFAGYSWSRPFFPGRRNVEVTYIAGYNPIPPVLWMATVDLIKYIWVNTQQAAAINKNDIYSSDDTGSALWAGVPYRIQSWIAPYRRLVIA